MSRQAGAQVAALAMALAMAAFGWGANAATTACPPRPPLLQPSRTPRCAFSDAQLSYEGAPREQALCLMPVGDVGHFAPRTSLGAPLDRLVGTPARIDRTKLLALLAANGVAYPAGAMDAGLSHARGGASGAPEARYFVIHDTSGPVMRGGFPRNSDPSLNRLGSEYCGGGFAAHAFVNRLGRVMIAYDFATPWRATKFESSDPARKGLFLHVELNQPRRPRRGEDMTNASLTPDPPFTYAQYDALALLYATASARAGRWMTPAFHSAIDSAWEDDHDDPRGFDLPAFDAALANVLRQASP